MSDVQENTRLRGHLMALDGVRRLAILMVLLVLFVANMQLSLFDFPPDSNWGLRCLPIR
jgi:hypothetical protein